jgi:hypothetical protein
MRKSEEDSENNGDHHENTTQATWEMGGDALLQSDGTKEPTGTGTGGLSNTNTFDSTHEEEEEACFGRSQPSDETNSLLMEPTPNEVLSLRNQVEELQSQVDSLQDMRTKVENLLDKSDSDGSKTIQSEESRVFHNYNLRDPLQRTLSNDTFSIMIFSKMNSIVETTLSDPTFHARRATAVVRVVKKRVVVYLKQTRFIIIYELETSPI